MEVFLVESIQSAYLQLVECSWWTRRSSHSHCYSISGLHCNQHRNCTPLVEKNKTMAVEGKGKTPVY